MNVHTVSSKICVHTHVLWIHVCVTVIVQYCCVCASLWVCVCVFVRWGGGLLLSLSDNCVQNVKQTVAGTKPQGHSAICCCSSCICMFMCVCVCATLWCMQYTVYLLCMCTKVCVCICICAKECDCFNMHVYKIIVGLLCVFVCTHNRHV